MMTILKSVTTLFPQQTYCDCGPHCDCLCVTGSIRQGNLLCPFCFPSRSKLRQKLNGRVGPVVAAKVYNIPPPCGSRAEPDTSHYSLRLVNKSLVFPWRLYGPPQRRLSPAWSAAPLPITAIKPHIVCTPAWLHHCAYLAHQPSPSS